MCSIIPVLFVIGVHSDFVYSMVPGWRTLSREGRHANSPDLAELPRLNFIQRRSFPRERVRPRSFIDDSFFSNFPKFRLWVSCQRLESRVPCQPS